MVDLATLKAQALQLDPENRATLVDVILESLDLAESDVVHDAWLEEVRRRRAEVASGSVQLLPGDDLLAALESSE